MTMDRLIDDLGGCGLFQVLLYAFISLPRVVGSMSLMFMAFGNYNPGWQCMDNNRTSDVPTTDNISMDGNNDKDKCDLFESCSNVKFNPGVSTVVSEWQLVCDRAWIPSLIISIQMVGLLVGSFITGYLGDRLGRKLPLYSFVLGHLVINIITIYSNSWYTFTVMRFLIGLALPIQLYIPLVLSMEYLQYRWRPIVSCFPTFAIGCTIFALLAWAIPDWKWLHGINAIASFIAVLPYYWMPDSLRWLVVQDRMKAATSIVKTISRVNRVENVDSQDLEAISNSYRNQPEQRSYSCLHLLRKGVRYPTFVLGFTIASLSLISYAIIYGVKSMPGNFYTNLILIGCSSIPMSFVSATLPNFIGRRKACIFFLTLSTLSLCIIVGLDLGTEGRAKRIGVIVGTIVGRMNIEASWDTILTYTGEFYPTVIRSTSLAYTSWIARIGGILAPYLIPENPDTYYINYLIMGMLAFICSVLFVFLPEKKRQPMQDVWGKKADDESLHGNGVKEKEDGDVHSLV